MPTSVGPSEATLPLHGDKPSFFRSMTAPVPRSANLHHPRLVKFATSLNGMESSTMSLQRSKSGLSRLATYLATGQDDDDTSDESDKEDALVNFSLTKIKLLDRSGLVPKVIDYEIPLLPPGVKKHDIRFRRKTKFVLTFNTYKRLYVITILVNAIMLGLAATGSFPAGKENSASFALGNILLAVAIRSELILWGLFDLTDAFFGMASIKPWTSVWVRSGAVLVLMSFGGIHSAAAISALAWLIVGLLSTYSVALLFTYVGVHSLVKTAAIATTCTMFIVILTAQAPVRYFKHDVFEHTHRWLGWTSMAFVWVFVLSGAYYLRLPDVSFGEAVLHDRNFWLALVLNVFLIVPWISVRKIPVKVMPGPNGKAAVLKFDGPVGNGLLGRLARGSGLSQWHAFGIVGEGPKADCHYMVVGVQGGWTSALVHDPPSHLYTRTVRFAGISRLVRMFTRAVAICTGSGIGASLSIPMQNDNVFLIWIASDMEMTFGSTLQELIEKTIPPERRIIFDTKKAGRRPDTVQLLKDVFHAYGAEIVFITSNPRGTVELMRICRENNMPCLGPIFDS
ncbi:hypothetical protein HDU93_009388 [Gonapodya sp. JEL0774]|nr:hypothetical protein HDU93_009388 [Gonapodya sp. JEL0774]